MTGNEYQKLALRTMSPLTSTICDVPERLTCARLLEGLMGLNGEAGECIDIYKKNLFQGHEDLDREHLAEELGDVAWYLAESAFAIGYKLDDIFEMNIKKLEKRYPNGFEAVRSINREV